MKDLLEAILVEIVDRADELDVVELLGTQNAMYEIHCHKGDIGKILGRDGHMITALRTIFSSIASRQGLRINLTVVQ